MSLSLKTPWEVSMGIAGRLKAKRLARNLTQQGLAARAGMSVGSVKRFEKNGLISFVSLLNIALVLDCLDECYSLFKENEKPASLFKEEPARKRRQRGKIK